MKRVIMIAVALVVFIGSSAQAQLDEVRFMNRTTNKEDSIKGTIDQESPAGIRIKQRAMGTDIPAADILLVIYHLAGITVLDFRAPFGKEIRGLTPGASEKLRKDLLAEALKGFEELLPKVSVHPRAKRYIQFKIATVKAAQAETEVFKRAGAIAALQAFKIDHPDSWQIVAALKILAKLLEDQGDVQEARKTYEELGKVAGIPAETKLESDVLVAKLLMRGSKYADAEAKLKSLSTTLPNDDPQKPSLLILLAQAQIEQNNLGGVEPLLRSALASTTTDPTIRAHAHNTLGDYFQKKSQLDDAFWEYLKVDVLYNQDREQQAKALYFLSKLFDKVKNDPIRARECKERLADKVFAGLDYAKRSADEK